MRKLFWVAMAGIALVLSGCIVFASPGTTASSPTLGPVTLRTTLCASDADPSTAAHADACQTAAEVEGSDVDGNSDGDADRCNGCQLQALLGYRVPAGAEAPRTIQSGVLTFIRSPS